MKHDSAIGIYEEEQREGDRDVGEETLGEEHTKAVMREEAFASIARGDRLGVCG